jgi:hypothetical protein
VVVVMASEIFRQFITRSVIGRDKSTNNPSFFEYRKVSIRRTLCHPRRHFDDLEDRHRATCSSQRVDEYSPIGRVTLTIAAESLVSGVMHVDRVGSHGVESLRL